MDVETAVVERRIGKIVHFEQDRFTAGERHPVTFSEPTDAIPRHAVGRTLPRPRVIGIDEVVCDEPGVKCQSE